VVQIGLLGKLKLKKCAPIRSEACDRRFYFAQRNPASAAMKGGKHRLSQSFIDLHCSVRPFAATRYGFRQRFQ
jgi:hypothetical protein